MTWPSFAFAIASIIVGWTPALLSLAKLRDGFTCLVMKNCLQVYSVIVICALYFDFPDARIKWTRFRREQSTKYKAPGTKLSCFSRLKVLNNLSRCIRARGPGNSTARMRACATEVKSPDRGSILRPTNNWTKGEKLIERLFTVMNMPAAESVCLFQIKWSNDLPGDDHLFQIWGVAG